MKTYKWYIGAGALIISQLAIGISGAVSARAAVQEPARPGSYIAAYREISVTSFHSQRHPSLPSAAMNWAITQKGCWYQWGGTGPCGAGYDCSGLVYAAYLHAGIRLPRTTYDMLDDVGVIHLRRHFWWKLIRVDRPGRGDMAFYGSGHVELMSMMRHTTFGAHDQGTQLGWVRWNSYWQPTEFLHLLTGKR